MQNKRVYIVAFFAFVILLATVLTEQLFYRQDKQIWMRVLEERLHNQENKADEILSALSDSVHFNTMNWEDEITILAFRKGELFFWDKELIGAKDLFTLLSQKAPMIKLGNSYYEVRRRKQQESDYFALIRIVDFYPYTTKYVKNRFADFLDISEQNIDQCSISLEDEGEGMLIKNREGEGLFYLIFGEHYREWIPKYLLISLYLLVFLSLFYLYDKILKSSACWKKQLLWFAGFLGLLFALRCFMQVFHFPTVIYSLPIFEEKFAGNFFVTSIGDLFLMTFSILQLVTITIANVHLNGVNPFFRRYRYLMAILCFTSVFLYVAFFNFSVSLVMEFMDVHLNIAQLFGVGVASIFAFVAINFGGLIILILMFGSLSLLQHLFSFKQILVLATLMSGLFCLLSGIWDFYVDYWDVAFIYLALLLLMLNRYLLKSEIQKGIYILTVFLLCIYIVLMSREYERSKELQQRESYATELLEERDYNFEKRLLEYDSLILQSQELFQVLDTADTAEVLYFLENQLLDMSGYNYKLQVSIGNRLETDGSQADTKGNWDQLIREYGVQIGDSHFYAINLFDGWIVYVGRFIYDKNEMYLCFKARQEEERVGYAQVLSRKSESTNRNLYLYSYAKYVQGELAVSYGNFVYHKYLDAWENTSERESRIFTKDQYLHMLIPVGKNSTLVISTPDHSFGLYYMNVLYAFIVCILLSSHSLFFRVNATFNSRKDTLQARIKNSIIGLMLVLLVLLTVLSIYMNTKSFENRHRAQVIELLKYVHEELEDLDCVDWSECPSILERLSEISESLAIDVNIYSDAGKLVSTSRPEIFQYGFEGVLMNPKAWHQIVKEKSTHYIEKERVGELKYMSVYMPLVLSNNKSYVLNVPYFTQNEELNLDILIMVVIMLNIAIVVIVLAFIFSNLIAERLTKPLQMVNEKFKRMQIGGKNEKIKYQYKDEIALLICEYNNMVDKLEENVAQLARSEREYAWREMARQIAHEIKNPLTPMKLNIQFLLRALEAENSEKFAQRFREVARLLMEQIDNMARTASAFSDFAKMSVMQREVFVIGELVRDCVELFRNNVDVLECEIDRDVKMVGDKEQMRRVIINLLKNAEQSIPQGRERLLSVNVLTIENQIEIRIRDNGCGIPSEIGKKIFEPNFTTKSGGSGLGLAICQKIVEELNGRIEFTSELNVGTEFLVVLPKYQK